jgi:hypothetical protein
MASATITAAAMVTAATHGSRPCDAEDVVDAAACGRSFEHAFKRQARVADVTQTLSRVFLQTASRHGADWRGPPAAIVTTSAPCDHRAYRLGEIVAVEGASAGEHLKTAPLLRPDVRALVDRLPARLLG